MSRLNQFLVGVRVLDLSQYLPGPTAALFLADMGAEVLKVEPPSGDEMRNLGPRDQAGRPVYYRTLNAGKAVLRLNLKDGEAHAEFLRLAAEADVLIEGFRPGVMARLGLGYRTLKAINPRLVYCSLSGYGADGAYSQIAGHDGNYLAEAGVLDRNGDDRPLFFDPPVADVCGALYAALAIVAALKGREATGEGCEIDLALADVAMSLQAMQVAGYGANGTVPARRGTYLNGGAAYYRIYETRDHAFLMVGAVEPKFWAAFCAAAEQPEWIERQAEPTPQHPLIADLSAYFASLDCSDALRRFSSSDCCVSLVQDLGQALRSDRVRQRGLVRVSPAGELQTLFPAVVDGERPASRAEVRELRPGEPVGFIPAPHSAALLKTRSGS